MKTQTMIVLAIALATVSMSEAAGRRRGWSGDSSRSSDAQQSKQTEPQAIESKSPPQVDKAEVIRRGDLEEYVDGDSKFSTEYGDHITEIAAAPANDNSKWFVSVIGKKDCPACARLKELWKENDTLRAYAKPDDPRTSWAHFTWYDYDDPYQKWRWTKSAQNPNPIEITAFPTIIVQPPRSKKYGDPQTVVLKYVWENDPEAFSRVVNNAIRAYVDTLHKKGLLNGDDEEPKLSVQAQTKATTQPSNPSVVKASPPDGFRALEEELFVEAPIIQNVADGGIGQQQIPPLDLPLDNNPKNDNPRSDMRNGKRQILIITDSELRTTDAQQEVINETVDSLQESPALPVREVPIEKCPRQLKDQVRVDDLPAVLLVEGTSLIEKRLPRPEAGFFGGPFSAIWKAAGTFISLVVWIISSACTLLVLLFFVIVGVRTLQWAEILPKPLINRSTTPTSGTGG